MPLGQDAMGACIWAWLYYAYDTLTCLITAKQLSSYPTRENKSFTLLLCWTTQLIQYVPIHNKYPVTSWQCFEMHIFNTDLLSAKLQHMTPVLTARTVRFVSAPLILTLWGGSTGIICLFTPITLYSVFRFLTRADKVPEVQYPQGFTTGITKCINCYSAALFKGTLVAINIWYTTIFNTTWKTIDFKVGDLYTFKLTTHIVGIINLISTLPTNVTFAFTRKHARESI